MSVRLHLCFATDKVGVLSVFAFDTFVSWFKIICYTESWVNIEYFDIRYCWTDQEMSIWTANYTYITALLPNTLISAVVALHNFMCVVLLCLYLLEMFRQFLLFVFCLLLGSVMCESINLQKRCLENCHRFLPSNFPKPPFDCLFAYSACIGSCSGFCTNGTTVSTQAIELESCLNLYTWSLQFDQGQATQWVASCFDAVSGLPCN